MKAETALATLIMAVCGLIVVILAAGALAPPTTQGAAPQTSRPQQSAPVSQPVALSTREPLQVATAEGQGDAAARDARRLSDLQAIATALQSYNEKKKAYPETGGRLQTGCVYESIDKLCELRPDVGLERLRDARGANTFGYWYISDGRTYTIIASLEAPSEAGDPCPPAAAPLRAANVFCLNSHR